MRRTWYTTLCIFSLVFSIIFGSVAQAVEEIPDGPPAAATPRFSHRLIVELRSPPLAAIYSKDIKSAEAGNRLAVRAPAAQAYIAQLQAEQAAFISEMQAVAPGATVAAYVDEQGLTRQATYQVVFNGVAVDPGPVGREAARVYLMGLPNVKAVHYDRAYETQLYTSTSLINAPMVWNNPAIGGVGNAGAGIKIASIDGGLHKDAPMFSGAGYSYPPSYSPNGLGLTANNNGKIIVSRAYFRPWDPPAPGNENPWPGVTDTPHGVHTGSTAGGNCVDNVVYGGYTVGAMCGVAPKAYLMSYKMFYTSVNGNESSYTVETLAVLEDIVKDGADVVNNSWGEGPITEGGPFDPVDAALINASKASVFVSMSAGNSGPGLGTTDHPSADYISVAASTTSGTLATGRLGVANQPDLQDLAFASASFGAPLPVAQIVEYDYLPSAVADPNNVLGCDPWPAGTFVGKAALIRRGDCEFSVKILNAELAGASFVVVYNHTDGGDELIGMAPGTVGDQVTISAIFIGNTDGEALVQHYNDNGPAAARIVLNTISFQIGNLADRITDFSSRGPGVGNVLKPDIAAPGVNILAQGYAEGVTGEARHVGYGQVSGTSMAAPHVAGAAALLRQLYPSWSNAAIKSALMSTAKYMDVYNFDETPAQPLDMGAGRLDVGAAMNPGVILNPPSLSFGLVLSGTQETISVTVTSVAGAPEAYTISTLYTGDGFTQTTSLPGFGPSAASITLNPGESKTVAVTFNPAMSRGYGDNQGYIVMTGSNGHKAHMPAWARVLYAQPLADVLIIDNDASEIGQPDYMWYYADALDKLGYTYNVISTLIEGVPDATTLAAYKAVVMFSGDNYLGTVSQNEKDRLVEYLNGGGSLIVMGQDMSASLWAAGFDPPVGSRDFFYVYRLGANWVQDSVSAGITPDQFIVPTSSAPAALAGVRVDLTQPHGFIAGGDLTGDQETPPVATHTAGSFFSAYNLDQNALTYGVTVVPTDTEPITVTGAHIHLGAVGVAGPVVRGLDQGGVLPSLVTDTLTLAGVIADLTSVEVAQMLNGQFYINVHTTHSPDGELRAQIEPLALPNQPYVDEIDNVFHDGSQEPGAIGTSESNLGSDLILRYAGPNNIFDGAVASAHRDQPSLERPGTDYAGRSIYATFGLEGMNESLNLSLGYTPTTRAELLDAFLHWTWSEPGTVTIENITTPNNAGFNTFRAVLADDVLASPMAGAQAVSYRWDFGDGSPFVPSASEVVGYAYRCGGDNIYTVRVEVIDQRKNAAIGSLAVDLSASCLVPTALDETDEPTDQYRGFLPFLANPN